MLLAVVCCRGLLLFTILVAQQIPNVMDRPLCLDVQSLSCDALIVSILTLPNHSGAG